MEIRRVALIYDDRPRPETTGFCCRRALDSLVEVMPFRPDDLATISRGGFDLYLNVDDGLDYGVPPDLRPCAWWAIDTHVGFARCFEKARNRVIDSTSMGTEADTVRPTLSTR